MNKHSNHDASHGIFHNANFYQNTSVHKKAANSNEQALIEMLKLQKDNQAISPNRNRRAQRELNEKSSRNNNYLDNDVKSKEE